MHSTPQLRVAESDMLGLVGQAVHQRIVGQEAAVSSLLVALLTGGHVLIEGLPGLAKTLMVRSLADAVSAKFRRIQFTPDLLPGDILGTSIYDQHSGEFRIHKGPIFANIILADEINRTPPKVQSALLEAMEERQVTLAGETYPLEHPFLVLATQNPVEQHGTYPLAEAQLDRFMMKLKIGYPRKEEEKQIVRRIESDPSGLRKPAGPPAASIGDILVARTEVASVHLSDSVLDYIVELVCATRAPSEYGLPELEALVEFGVSPRATIFLTRAARAQAYISGRDYVIADDVKATALPVLRHRLRTTYEADANRMDSDDVLQKIIGVIAAPV